LYRALGIADDLRVGNAALGAHLGGDVVRLARAGAVVEIVAYRRIAVMREPTRCLAVPLVPTRRVMEQNHPREGTRAQRPRNIGRDRFVVVAADRDRFRDHSFVGHRPTFPFQSVC
jgi:hypothetical protein